ncbi:hypothetical protein Ljor_1766 [Legionella jordanis]|uniref:Uncharacterized protein n=1 Tax=Legionella jordanis TaxID=456 RepID=A0A0W0VBF9_9GAMM|nr:hypothetical protein [Legionella jordanis]KTD17460.1 hypothetical protein Ljor_1766 [Legionella jordanis]VEH13429.1 Uncharacterised protein [Legionella jordanis]
MFSLRDLIIFLAGAEFWHTFTHIFFAFFVSLPIDFNFYVLTPTKNFWGIIINGIITIILLWWAKRLTKKR